MIHGKSVLAIIPARAGSKGLPRKNIKTICGKPLIAWSIQAGLASQYVDKVVVTTDSDEIAMIANEYGADTPFIRPAELASDLAATYDVVKHAIDFYSKELNFYFDYIVLLEPTSPLREKGDIDEMLEELVLKDSEFDAIVSLGAVHEHPSIMKKIIGNKMEAFRKDLIMPNRRQENEATYFPYGVAYIIKSTILIKERTFYPLRTTYKVVKRYQCYEIDDIYDFLSVESIMKYEWNIK